ncbi:condensin complex subunit 2-like [Impatiens glandulifera]|uniref:condensin complex subunit 2-like n=1 Tax=Impatiens glandulifera TaxID=253017 RepID=UPI001FB06329|nr:condensin complex subunit 2-like [Impatiens glandulifera]
MEKMSGSVLVMKKRFELDTLSSPYVEKTMNNSAVASSSAAAAAAAIPTASVPHLDKNQILDLLSNCMKLASENKINQKNAWELNLIDHLSDVLKMEEEDGTETNFQKASCTLEAAVQIYSMRVDYVHSEAYKVLGVINRVGRKDEEGSKYSQGESSFNKGSDWEVSPLSTLKSSFEALNVKKFDVAFTVDPLYHQTSALFDEGGVKGLLLNHLEIYGSCQVLFDSFEVPGKFMKCGNQLCNQDTIDLSFAKDCIDKMVVGMRSSEEISPTLKHIVNLFDESERRSSNTFTSVNHVQEEFHETCNDAYNRDNAELGLDDSGFDNGETWAFKNADLESVVGEDLYGGDPSFGDYHEEGEPSIFQPHNLENSFDNVVDYMYLSLGINSKHNAWAGPDHWKYRKLKLGLAEASKEDGLAEAKKAKSKRAIEVDIDFMKTLDNDFMKALAGIFAPPMNPKSLLLSANRAPIKKLPEDCHYEPENLVKLFLLPEVMCSDRRKWRKSSCEDNAPWEDNAFIGELDNEDDHTDVEDLNNLVPQPRRVNKIEVKYDKLSKEVDVQALKEKLWVSIQAYNEMTTQDDEKETVSFREVLASFPSDNCKADGTEDISVHLRFMCLLHLANEHGLSLLGSSEFDDVTVHLPSK